MHRQYENGRMRDISTYLLYSDNLVLSFAHLMTEGVEKDRISKAEPSSRAQASLYEVQRSIRNIVGVRQLYTNIAEISTRDTSGKLGANGQDVHRTIIIDWN